MCTITFYVYPTVKTSIFLRNSGVLPKATIPQDRPLSVNSYLTPEMDSENLFFLPETYMAQLEMLPNYSEYDMIIVSNAIFDYTTQSLLQELEKYLYNIGTNYIPKYS